MESSTDYKNTEHLWFDGAVRINAFVATRVKDESSASLVADTQAEAILGARKMEPDATVLVERVRHTNVGKPDKCGRCVIGIPGDRLDKRSN